VTQPPAGGTAGVVAYVGLGGNLGSEDELRARLQAAVAALDALPGTRVDAMSSLYWSAPVEASGPTFLNAVARLRTQATPWQTLAALQAIEAGHGRERSYRNAPRTLDLDLLLHGQSELEEPALSLPHPRMAQRAFVLLPLAELDSGLLIPGQGAVASLLPAVAGQAIRAGEAPGQWWPAGEKSAIRG
jgi:2-amino-4-hydroxy-6-hydroxymethyldihydropteridine diphosphokinase